MKLTKWDRFLAGVFPRWGTARIRARAAAEEFVRSYEAAARGRRTDSWGRSRGDANSMISRAGDELRAIARNLERNNGRVARAIAVIADNVVGWGIVPRPPDADVSARWKSWAESRTCDFDGRLTFYGLQHLVMATVVRDGEVLVRRRWVNGNMCLQVIESDWLDRTRDMVLPGGGSIVGGIELNAQQQRVAYHLFRSHPGSSTTVAQASERVPVSEVEHVFEVLRPGQLRGASWFATAILKLNDLDDYEDAELVRQKIAACFAAFVTDPSGTAAPLGAVATDTPTVESFEPGMITHLKPGQDVAFATPPVPAPDEWVTRQLQAIAAALGVTYEDLTGDYSRVNFSSARMGRIAHSSRVRAWQTKVMLPTFCETVWRWFVEAGSMFGEFRADITTDWTCSPLPMIEPDREGLAYSRLVRNGVMTPSDVIREQGGDPESHWISYAADMTRLDKLGIKLDCDVRAVSQAGLTQERAGLTAKSAAANDEQS